MATRKNLSANLGRVRLGATHLVPPGSGIATAAGARRAEQLIARAKNLKRRIASDFYELGKTLEQLAQPAAYGALGYDSFEDLLVGRKLGSRMQAHKLIEVARTYPKPIALKLGIEKAYTLTRLVEATPARDIAADLARRDVRIAGKPLSKLTHEELREAARRADGGLPTTAPEISPEARRAARSLQRDLRRRGAEGATVRARLDGAKHVLEIRLALEHADVI